LLAGCGIDQLLGLSGAAQDAGFLGVDEARLQGNRGP
jgi:hypothetical protein